jgi:hypothetical protein
MLLIVFYRWSEYIVSFLEAKFSPPLFFFLFMTLLVAWLSDL